MSMQSILVSKCMENPLSVYREPTSYASKSARQNSVLSFFRIQFAPYFLPPPAQEVAIRMLATSGEIPITSQHLCRGFLHGNEGHIWHHRPSFQPARPYPASRQAAGAEVSLSSSPVSWPAKQCCCLLRPSPGGSLAPFGGLGALARRLFLSARMRCSSESLIFNFQGS